MFFAGHSTNDKNHKFGSFQINDKESIDIDEIQESICQSLTKGLKLAIFNSCDGLGLAHQLSQLNVPYLIVMRQLIPDPIAIDFLKYLLKAFAGSDHQRSTKSLHLAMREARTRLGQDKRFPCASWLPVLFQNPTEEYLTWESLQGYDPEQTNYNNTSNNASIVAQQAAVVDTPPTTPDAVIPEQIIPEPLPIFDFHKFKHKLKKASLVSTIAAIAAIGLRLTGYLEPLELYTYDRMMHQLPDRGPDPRIVIVRITEEDYRGKFLPPMSDETLTRLLQAVKINRPLLIGLDIIRDTPVPPTSPELAELWQDQSIIPVCYTGDDADAKADSTGFSPGIVDGDRIGFIDLIFDEYDDAVRRQLLKRNPVPESRCQTSQSFSFKLAFQYLEKQADRVIIDRMDTRDLKILVMRAILGSMAGGYQELPAFTDQQILLRYRTKGDIASWVGATDLLLNPKNPEFQKKLQDKIVLIGTTAPTAGDIHRTPYSQMRGVEIHAHMISQLISAAEDGQALLTVWPTGLDWLWIWGWTLLGGLLVLPIHNRLLVWTKDGIIITILYQTCAIIFSEGLWVPFIPAALSIVVSSQVIFKLTS